MLSTGASVLSLFVPPFGELLEPLQKHAVLHRFSVQDPPEPSMDRYKTISSKFLQPVTLCENEHKEGLWNIGCKSPSACPDICPLQQYKTSTGVTSDCSFQVFGRQQTFLCATNAGDAWPIPT